MNDGGPAFPTHADAPAYAPQGMSLRDWFAGQVVDGIYNGARRWSAFDAVDELGIKSKDYDASTHGPILAAREAYRVADAMLAARDAKKV